MNRQEAIKMIMDRYKLFNRYPDRFEDEWYELNIEFTLVWVDIQNHNACYHMTMIDKDSCEGISVIFDYQKAKFVVLSHYAILRDIPIDSFTVREWDSDNRLNHTKYEVKE